MTEFQRTVARIIRASRPGEVLTYGEIAAEAGHAGAARAVGNLLAASDESLPWWRVVNHEGRLAPGKEREQAGLLRGEGVSVVGHRVRMLP